MFKGKREAELTQVPYYVRENGLSASAGYRNGVPKRTYSQILTIRSCVIIHALYTDPVLIQDYLKVPYVALFLDFSEPELFTERMLFSLNIV